jgi:hypothetical protein
MNMHRSLWRQILFQCSKHIEACQFAWCWVMCACQYMYDFVCVWVLGHLVPGLGVGVCVCVGGGWCVGWLVVVNLLVCVCLCVCLFVIINLVRSLCSAAPRARTAIGHCVLVSQTRVLKFSPSVSRTAWLSGTWRNPDKLQVSAHCSLAVPLTKQLSEGLTSPIVLWLCLKGLGLKPFLRWPPCTYIHNAHVDIIHTHRCIYVMHMHT